MPSRPTTLLIVLFWACAVAWFVHREVWPTLVSSSPMPFTIELADEAVRHFVPLRWGLYRNGVRIGAVRTAVDYRESDDTFALNATAGPMVVANVLGVEVKLSSLSNQYRVRRDGRLTSAETVVHFDVVGNPVDVTITAEVRGGQVTPSCRIGYPGGELRPPVEPFPVSRAGMLNPLHPVHRIAGVRLGQRWVMPLDDPLADAIRAAFDGYLRQQFRQAALALPRTGPRSLTATVVGPRSLLFNNQDEECLVIEYRGDDYTAETWVRRSDGAVLKQLASGGGETLALVRE